MGLDQIANIAEISAAVLVVASLIYVGRQLNQNTQSMRLDTVQAIIAEWNAWYDMMTPNKELIDLYHRGVFDYQSLNSIERMQFIFMTTRIFRTFNEMYFHWREGMMDKQIWSSWVAQFNDAMKTPGWQEAWARRRHWYDAGFQSFVDDRIADANNVKPMYEPPDPIDTTR
jgi:hypothetical protein